MNKENKDNKKTIKTIIPVKDEFETNFDFIFSKVRESMRTEENKTYLIDNYKDKVDYYNTFSMEEMNEELGYLVSGVESAIAIKPISEANMTIEENKEKFLIEKKKESGLFEMI